MQHSFVTEGIEVIECNVQNQALSKDNPPLKSHHLKAINKDSQNVSRQIH